MSEFSSAWIAAQSSQGRTSPAQPAAPVSRSGRRGRPFGSKNKTNANEGPPLEECPQAFREIFADCQFPPGQVRELILSAAKTTMQDYLLQPELQKDEGARARQERARKEAREWIFPGKLDRSDPFSFEYACEIMGLNPDRVRARLEAATPEDLAGMRKMFRSRDRDID